MFIYLASERGRSCLFRRWWQHRKIPGDSGCGWL